jgi:ketosteroid isomerase-like protein
MRKARSGRLNHMTTSHANRADIVRDCYRAYETRDRDLIDRHLADDFAFFSPPDPGLDRAQYFERCWPNAQHLRAFDFVRVLEAGDEVVVTYECERDDGTRFRNTEVFTFAGGRVARVEVYFGWDL